VPVPIIGTSATRVSCPSATKCVSVDNPTCRSKPKLTESGRVELLDRRRIFPDQCELSSTTECLVVGYNNANSEEVYSVGVLSGVNQTWTWSASADIPPTHLPKGSCTSQLSSTTVCIATGADAGVRASMSWAAVTRHGHVDLDDDAGRRRSTSADEFFGVSCPTTALCVADGLSNGDEAIYATGTTLAEPVGRGQTRLKSRRTARWNERCRRHQLCERRELRRVGTDKNGAPVYFAGSYAGVRGRGRRRRPAGRNAVCTKKE